MNNKIDKELQIDNHFALTIANYNPPKIFLIHKKTN